jgi:hypothetical protein
MKRNENVQKDKNKANYRQPFPNKNCPVQGMNNAEAVAYTDIML